MKTYTAKLFKVPFYMHEFHIAGTIDGEIDLALPTGGTYQLTVKQAEELAIALMASVEDVEANEG